MMATRMSGSAEMSRQISASSRCMPASAVASFWLADCAAPMMTSSTGPWRRSVSDA
jgi:hypothetical protein